MSEDQCRRKPKWGPRTTTIGPSIFWRPIFSRHPPHQQPPYRFCRLLLLQFSSAWALSNLILPLPQPIRPFTIPRPFKGPLYTAIGPFFPVSPVASLGWVTPGAATKGVTPLFFPEKPGDLLCSSLSLSLSLFIGLTLVSPHTFFTCPTSFLHYSL